MTVLDDRGPHRTYNLQPCCQSCFSPLDKANPKCSMCRSESGCAMLKVIHALDWSGVRVSIGGPLIRVCRICRNEQASGHAEGCPVLPYQARSIEGADQ